MTRINVIPVELLIDQFLLAEYREITRISKLARMAPDAPKEYTLGTGHVKFFYDKGEWLAQRTKLLYNECIARGFNVQYKEYVKHSKGMDGDYKVEDRDVHINMQRLHVRCMEMKREPTINSVKVNRTIYERTIT